MKKRFRFLLILTALAGFCAIQPACAQQGGTEGIAVVVNNDAITTSDLDARTKLLLASSSLPDTPDVATKMKPEIINSLIEEKLMMQEAKRDKITVTQAEIEDGLATLAKQNNMTADQFKGLLTHGGIPVQTLYNQIEAQISWSKVVEQKIRPDINISGGQVDAALARLKSDIGKTQYLVADIYLPVNAAPDEPAVVQLADRLEKEIGEGHAPFQKVASQFSQAPGASKGGDLGWIQEGQLAPELDHELAQMKEGELSNPIRSGGGYHILLLRKKTVATADTLPSRDEVLQNLGLETLDRLQRHYMMNLKASAFIEHRA